MGRRRRLWIKDVHSRLQEWSYWHLTHMLTSPIGYPAETFKTETPCANFGPIVPDLMAPPTVKEIYRALLGMPEELECVVQAHYLDGVKVPRRQLDNALIYLAGVLQNRKY